MDFFSFLHILCKSLTHARKNESFVLSIWLDYYKQVLRSFDGDRVTHRPKSMCKYLIDNLTYWKECLLSMTIISNSLFPNPWENSYIYIWVLEKSIVRMQSALVMLRDNMTQILQKGSKTIWINEQCKYL